MCLTIFLVYCGEKILADVVAGIMSRVNFKISIILTCDDFLNFEKLIFLENVHTT